MCAGLRICATLMLDTYYPFDRMMDEETSPVLAHTEADYKLPLTIHDKPTGRIWVEKMGVTKWSMGFEIFQGDKIHCIGSQTGYFLNLKTGRPQKMPEGLLGPYNSQRSA